jgi:hypothetical protein
MRQQMSQTDLILRGAAAGLTGTAVMTAGYATEHRLRRSVSGPLDYDDSDAPAVAAGRVLRWLHVLDEPPGSRAGKVLGFLVHWGYGSLVGAAAIPLVRRTGPARASVGFAGAITVMAAVLFPLLGGTPAPWRWRRDVVATSLVQHLLYAATVVAVLRAEAVTDEDPSPGGDPAPSPR